MSDSTNPSGAGESTRRSDQEVMLALEAASVGTWTWDIVNGTFDGSESLGALYGLSTSGFKATLDFVAKSTHPDDRQRSAAAMFAAVQGDTPLDMERRVIWPDGSIHWLHSKGRVFRDESGEPIRMVGATMEVTAHHEAETTLRLQKALLEAQNQASLEGVLVVSPDAKILSCNRRFVEMWELNAEALASGLHLKVLATVTHKLANADELQERVAYLYAHPNESAHYEAVFKDGRVYRCYGVPLFGGDGVHLGRMLQFRDVSEDIRAEELKQERNSLRNAVKALDKVLGVVGHELRTPLAAVRMMSELLLGQQLDPEQKSAFLDSLHREVVRMASMVNDLLEVARLNSGTAQWNWGEVNVAEACGAAMDSVLPLLDGQKVALRLIVAPEPATMRGDADAVRRLVLNLVNNAAKHTRAGSIVVRIAPKHVGNVRHVQIDVEDTGEGITPRTAARLGEAFALNSGVIGDSHVRGSGLGLAICRGIAAAHGGTITVASEQGKGTSVTILLRSDLPRCVETPDETSVLRTTTR